MSEVTIVVDVHEPDAIKRLTVGHPDVDKWREDPLDAADIVVNGVGFERKTPSDFASSMLEDRLDEQVRKLDETYEHSVILLESSGFGEFSSLSHTNLKPESMRGKAASIHMRWGIPVIPTGGTAGTETARRLLVDYATRLGRKATEEPSSSYLKSSSVGSDEPVGTRLWACFDGVGPTRARALYGNEDVGSPLGIALTAETVSEMQDVTPREYMMSKLLDVDDIGEKTAERLVEQLLGE